jgi:type III pantothenate kinase
MNRRSETKRDRVLDAKEGWLGLMIGNSRLHWAWFIGETLCYAWDTEYLPSSAVEQLTQWSACGGSLSSLSQARDWARFFPANLTSQNQDRLLPLSIASVVPSQTAVWQAYPDVQVITLEQIPFPGVYPSLGIDRALALWGAGETWGWPMLVIDAGTALTFTGADANRCLVGGAILPGLSLQFQFLAQRTAGLPLIDTHNAASLPPRWALNTPDAIQSGVIYTLLAGIRDFVQAWWQEFPGSCITLTGGDRALLLEYLQSHFPSLATALTPDPHLIFWGMKFCRASSR